MRSSHGKMPVEWPNGKQPLDRLQPIPEQMTCCCSSTRLQCPDASNPDSSHAFPSPGNTIDWVSGGSSALPHHQSYLIFHFSRIMSNDEGILLLLWLFIELVFLVDTVEFLKQCFVGCSGEAKIERIREKSPLRKHYGHSPTHLHKSSKIHSKPDGFDSNNCKHPELSIKSISRHLMPSFLYSFCSYLKTCRLK